MQLDSIDHKILRLLQHDAAMAIESIGREAGLSRNACWRRIKQMEEAGIITARVALLDPVKVDLAQLVFISVRTNRHDPEWQAAFTRAIAELPEIMGVYRTAGDLDYLLKARVANVASYDRLYQRLIRKVELNDISASFVMEEIKETTALPLIVG